MFSEITLNKFKNKNWFYKLIYKISIGFIRKIYFSVKKLFFYITLEKFKGLYRPISLPFISGDTFRAEANHIHDETKKLNPKKVKKNDVVFLNADFIDEYFTNYHSEIREKYLLITQNSDVEIGDKYKKYVDQNIIKCFSQNLTILDNPSFELLPVGIENKRYLKNGILSHFKNLDKNFNKKKKTKIISAFNRFTALNRREELFYLTKEIDFIDDLLPVNHKKYMEQISEYKFALCPLGNGPDTHRLWECLMVYTIPIIIKCNFTENLKKMNAPFLEVDKWADIKNFSKDFLNNYYEKNINKETIDTITKFKYWNDRIQSNKL